MKLSRFIAVLLSALLGATFSCSEGSKQVYQTKNLEMAFDAKGKLVELKDKINNSKLLLTDIESYLLSLKVDSAIYNPEKAEYSEDGRNIVLHYKNGVQIVVQALTNDTHLNFEITSVSDEDGIDAVIWGPYNNTLDNSIGEVVGIAQGEAFTFGLMALNIKTLGGYPWNDDDHLPQMDIFSQSDVNNMVKEKDTPNVLYSVEAAKPVHGGSSLQAFTRNRSKDRIIKNWHHDKYLAPAYQDGGLVGSKIALYGCLNDNALNTIGEIEVAEGLPHPTIDGQWVKTSPIINSSYLIMDFTEENIDECLRYTKLSGFNYLYHGHPFKTWGHFPLIKEQFPNGYDGMKACVEKAEKEGIHIGTHTLSNFIHTTDAYVTPIPDKRLAKVGYSKLIKDVGADDTEIEIESPDFFVLSGRNNLHSAVIGDEIVRYGTISETAPWKLLDCQRGAFGTTASAHKQNDVIGKLTDHGYKVFLGDADLDKEIAEKIADFMNYTGVRMLDFDGLEGASSTAMGNYGEALMVEQWYNRLDDNLKSHFLMGASRPGHFIWHIYSRMNWGEPWYAGFRESQTEYRLFNQKFYKRNLMPGMLGWFNLTPNLPIEDVEWLMARSAGYDAGFAFVAGLKSLKANGNSEQILKIMNTWETARLAGKFSEKQKELMRDISNEFKLTENDDNSLTLTRVYAHKFKHDNKVRQPGEPLYSTFTFENNMEKQALGMIITANNADISGIKIEINNYKNLNFPITLKKGQHIRISDDKQAKVYDRSWNCIQTIDISESANMINKGAQSITFDCSFSNVADGASANVEFVVMGENEKVGK
ncbi:MAG: hypothetical protein ACK5IQ_08990 [Bacteroidales bacterium]